MTNCTHFCLKHSLSHLYETPPLFSLPGNHRVVSARVLVTDKTQTMHYAKASQHTAPTTAACRARQPNKTSEKKHSPEGACKERGGKGVSSRNPCRLWTADFTEKGQQEEKGQGPGGASTSCQHQTRGTPLPNVSALDKFQEISCECHTVGQNPAMLLEMTLGEVYHLTKGTEI